MIYLSVIIVISGIFLTLAALSESEIKIAVILFFITILGFIPLKYDLSSPIDVFESSRTIVSSLNKIEFEYPVRIISYDSEATRIFAVFGDKKNFKYKVEFLTKEEIEIWEKAKSLSGEE